MKHIARLLLRKDYDIEAPDLATAERIVQAMQKTLPYDSKLLGIRREGVPFDDESPTPPAGAPPSGSPGTPVVAKHTVLDARKVA